MKTRHHIIVGLALGCLLLVNAAALPQVVRHSVKHHHHSATTHTSTLCFWVCTAGQMQETDSPTPPENFYYIGQIDSPFSHSSAFGIVPLHIARGPPFHSDF